MTERYFGASGPETPAMMIHEDLMHKQQVLEDDHAGLASFAIQTPEVQVAELTGGHTLVLIDDSVQDGGAFKYRSSVANLAVLPEETEEVVIVTAGNAGMTLGAAALRRGIRSRAFTPDSLTDPKREGMHAVSMEIVLAGKDVTEVMPHAQTYVDTAKGSELVHPYNGLWGLAGLRYLGLDIGDALLKLSADGRLDLTRPTEVNVPLGGGSGVVGVASGLYTHKLNTSQLDTVSVHAIRPNRLPGGEMNPRFDGLRVPVPGSNTAPFLEDRRFVANTKYVDESNVADGTQLLAGLSDTMYEPNAVAAVAAATRWIADNPEAEPRNFVAVLTGRNTDPAQHTYFMQLRGYKETEEYSRRMADRQRRAAADLASLAFRNNLRVTHTGVRHDSGRVGTAALLSGPTLRSFVHLNK
jgi:threonine dehydratase